MVEGEIGRNDVIGAEFEDSPLRGYGGRPAQLLGEGIHKLP
jgi:hypothetical protein